MRTRFLSILLLAVACSSPPPAQVATAPTPATSSGAGLSEENTAPAVTPEQLTAPADHLTVGAFTLLRDGEPAIRVESDGHVESLAPQRALGKLGSDGRFTSSSGELIARLTEDGEIVTADGDYLPLTLNSSGEVKLLKENRTVRLRKNGTIEGANPGGPIITIEGVDSTTRRAAMFLLVLSAYPSRAGQ